MYDNLDMTLKKEHCPEIDFLQSVPQFLSHVSNYGENQFVKYVT